MLLAGCPLALVPGERPTACEAAGFRRVQRCGLLPRRACAP